MLSLISPFAPTFSRPSKTVDIFSSLSFFPPLFLFFVVRPHSFFFYRNPPGSPQIKAHPDFFSSVSGPTELSLRHRTLGPQLVAVRHGLAEERQAFFFGVFFFFFFGLFFSFCTS